LISGEGELLQVVWLPRFSAKVTVLHQSKQVIP
jgi:hypothetical protein